MLEVLLTIMIMISIWYSWQSLVACLTADLAEASWKELYKIAVNIVIIIYLYVQTNS